MEMSNLVFPRPHPEQGGIQPQYKMFRKDSFQLERGMNRSELREGDRVERVGPGPAREGFLRPPRDIESRGTCEHEDAGKIVVAEKFQRVFNIWNALGFVDAYELMASYLTLDPEEVLRGPEFLDSGIIAIDKYRLPACLLHDRASEGCLSALARTIEDNYPAVRPKAIEYILFQNSVDGHN